jgi:hypothetical protein
MLINIYGDSDEVVEDLKKYLNTSSPKFQVEALESVVISIAHSGTYHS